MTSGSGVLLGLPESAATAGSDPDDLAAPVLPARGADLVRGRHRATRAVRAGDQRGCAGLPLRTTRTGVTARHLPLRDSHDRSPSGYSPDPADGRSELSGEAFLSLSNLSRRAAQRGSSISCE